MPVDIYTYQNYRHYLLDLFAERRESSSGLSHREILSRMGITSSGFLSNILAGRNNLTPTQVTSLAAILALSKPETGYFESLVAFTQAKTTAERTRHCNTMAKLTRSRFKSLRPEQLSLFAKWHYAVIRELVHIVDFDGSDFRALGRMVTPAISADEAEQSIRELERIGLIEKNGAGLYRQKQGTVSTGDEIRSTHVASFITETARKVEHAIDTVPADERDCTVLTMKVSPAMMKQMKTEIQQFRKKLLAMAATDEDQNAIYQCAISFFPAAKKGA